MATKTYEVKSYHSGDGHENVQMFGCAYTDARQYLSDMRKQWEAMGLKVTSKRDRVEARGATYQMAVYFEEEKPEHYSIRN
jgi:hypothetical protein